MYLNLGGESSFREINMSEYKVGSGIDEVTKSNSDEEFYVMYRSLSESNLQDWVIHYYDLRLVMPSSII